MRALTLSWEWPPVVHGGLGRHVHGLSTALAGLGHRVVVVTPASSGAAGCEHVGGVEVRRVDVGAGIADLLRWPEAFAAAVEAVLDGDRPASYDVVHAHDWMTGAAAIAVAETLHAPLVVTVHATERGRHAGRLPDALARSVHEAEGVLTRRADAVVVCSAAMRAEVAEVHAVAERRIHVVPHGVDVAAWQTTPSSVAEVRHGADHLVVAAGRLEWEKGFSTLLRAMPALLARLPRTRVVLAGAGSYEPTLRRLAQDLGVTERLVLPGRLERAELAALYAAADVVVVPSRYEPSGLVALEAAAAGTPVVAAAVGGIPEVVADGVTGLLFPPGDVDRLAALLVELLPDRERRAALAAAGASALGPRTWAAAARRTADVWRSVRPQYGGRHG